MKNTLVTTFLLVFLLLLILYPFAALAGLMVLLVVATFLFFIRNLLQAIFSGNDADTHSP